METETLSWIEAARSGDRAALGRLAGAMQDRALAFAYGKLGDIELAREAAQDALIDAFSRLPELREPAAFNGWFRRVLLKHCDRRYRRKRLLTEELDNAQPPDPHDVEAALLDTEEACGLRDKVDRLPAAQRSVIALHYLADQSLEQIASLLEIEPNAVKQRLHVARNRLREAEPATRVDLLGTVLQAARASNDSSLVDTVRLFLAIRTGDVDQVVALLARNRTLVHARERWDVNALAGCRLPYPTQASPLIRASELGQRAIVEALLRSGAEVDRACGCETNESALWAAVGSNRVEVAALLLAHGADPNRRAKRGIAPLHIAAMRGWHSLSRLLLAHGASLELTDSDGRTASDWAHSKGHAPPDTATQDNGSRPTSVEWRDSVSETQIKAIDLFAPIVEGGLIRVEGGQGLGRNVLLAELAHQASSQPDTAVVWVSWDRERWSGSELEQLLGESALRERVHLLRYEHGESMRRSHSLPERALAFADGLCASGRARRVQLVFFEVPGQRAGVEALVPALRARPHFTTFFVDPWLSPETPVLKPPFDTVLTFDPELARAIRFPAIDTTRSRSRPVAGLSGGELADAARALLRAGGERAEALRAYLTQPFVVAEPHSGRPGERVPRSHMLADVSAILNGEADDMPLRELLYRGSLPSVSTRRAQ
jgi:RNA polymerase sigma factor (sigma-70 family)